MPIIVAGLGEPDENRDNASPGTKGCVASFIDEDRKVGAIVELHCESDFIARSDEFQNLARDIATHIAAADPKYICRKDVPSEVITKQKELCRAEANAAGKSGRGLEEYVESKLTEFYTAACLMEQRSIQNPEFTVGEIIACTGNELAVSIIVQRFVRFELGGKEITFAVQPPNQ
jgi:elongation factor Ts